MADAVTSVELKLAERTLELDSAIEELDSFEYSISHDLLAPLRVIEGFSAILATDQVGSQSGEGQSYLRAIRDSAERMQELVDGLLRLSRVRRQPLSKQPCSPAVLAEQALTQLGQDPHSNDIEIEVKPMPECFGDPLLLVDVWANLIGNAIKFRSPKTVAHIVIGYREQAGYPHYYVSDNGLGLDARHLDRIFRVFQRLQHSNDFKGTGVGLAIVSRILQRHGGAISVESEPGAGSTFLFTIPS